MSGRYTRILLSGLALSALAAPALAATPSSEPVPAVTGPIAAPDVPGSLSHNYVFFASNHELPARGYVEEEYFIKGNAATYDTPELKTGAVKDHQPYMTRIVVRRPADPKRFNGTVVVEWDNVSNFFDAENLWFFSWKHMLDAGYVWVGVSAQTVGVDALKKWNPSRYGQLDVGKTVANGSPAPGGPDYDAVSYDIFSQVGALMRHPGAIDPLHGLKPKVLIGAGESQSAARLAAYVNSVHPLVRVYDGFLLLSAVGRPLRPDPVSPVFRVSTEHDVVEGDAGVVLPDSPKYRSWDVAGSSHVDQYLRMSREALELRDNGKSLEAAMAPTCSVASVGTRVPTRYVVESALDKLSRWIAGGPLPPSAPHIKVLKVVKRPGASEIARNAAHLAEGGIQLAEIAVPTQLNMGVGAPSKAAVDAGINGEAVGPGACVRWGYSVDYTVDQLKALYPSHADYVAKVTKVTQDNLTHGYILPDAAAETIAAAKASKIGQ